MDEVAVEEVLAPLGAELLLARMDQVDGLLEAHIEASGRDGLAATELRQLDAREFVERALLGTRLLSASREVRPVAAVVALLEEVSSPRPDASQHQARAAAALREDLLQTGAFTYEEVARLRGLSKTSSARTWVARLRAAQRLFTVSAGGKTLVPAFQIDRGGRPRAEVADLLGELAGLGEWQTWAWLTTPTPLLSGGVPEGVARDQPERAVRAARRFAAQTRSTAVA